MNLSPSDVCNAKMQQFYHPSRWKINLHNSEKKYKANPARQYMNSVMPLWKSWKITILRPSPLFQALVIYDFFSEVQDFFADFYPFQPKMLISQPTAWPVVWYWWITSVLHCFIVCYVQILDNHTPTIRPLFSNSLIFKFLFFYSHNAVKKYIFSATLLRLEKSDPHPAVSPLGTPPSSNPSALSALRKCRRLRLQDAKKLFFSLKSINILK